MRCDKVGGISGCQARAGCLEVVLWFTINPLVYICRFCTSNLLQACCPYSSTKNRSSSMFTTINRPSFDKMVDSTLSPHGIFIPRNFPEISRAVEVRVRVSSIDQPSSFREVCQVIGGRVRV